MSSREFVGWHLGQTSKAAIFRGLALGPDQQGGDLSWAGTWARPARRRSFVGWNDRSDEYLAHRDRAAALCGGPVQRVDDPLGREGGGGAREGFPAGTERLHGV